ncbi:MAG: hypothetical protein ACTSUG_00550 [Candidatus Helarchaeota archaeon]
MIKTTNYPPKNIPILNKINNIWSKRKTLILSLLIFIIVFSLLGLPYTKWSFYQEDFASVWGSQNIKLTNWFLGKDLHLSGRPSNYISPKFSFFSAYYRPVVFLFYYFQSLFFGANAYGYFLITILLHALNSVILFNISLYFFDYLLAFSGALFFAFHSSLIGWLGSRGAQAIYITLLFLFLCFYSF